MWPFIGVYMQDTRLWNRTLRKSKAPFYAIPFTIIWGTVFTFFFFKVHFKIQLLGSVPDFERSPLKRSVRGKFPLHRAQGPRKNCPPVLFAPNTLFVKVCCSSFRWCFTRNYSGSSFFIIQQCDFQLLAFTSLPSKKKKEFIIISISMILANNQLQMCVS